MCVCICLVHFESCALVYFEFLLKCSLECYVTYMLNECEFKEFVGDKRTSKRAMSPVLVSSSQHTETVEAAMQAF